MSTTCTSPLLKCWPHQSGLVYHPYIPSRKQSHEGSQPFVAICPKKQRNHNEIPRMPLWVNVFWGLKRCFPLFHRNTFSIQCLKSMVSKLTAKINNQTIKQTIKQSNNQTIKQTNKQSNNQTIKQRNNNQTIKQSNNQKNKQSNNQKNKQTNKHIPMIHDFFGGNYPPPPLRGDLKKIKSHHSN